MTEKDIKLNLEIVEPEDGSRLDSLGSVEPWGAPGLHFCQKQDADSEKGAMREAGVWGRWAVTHRERKTGLQREASRNPERERIETLRLGETGTPWGRERDRDSERREQRPTVGRTRDSGAGRGDR